MPASVPTQTDKHPLILCRTRTGKKVHMAHPGSSVLVCGHWLRVSSTAMLFPKNRVVEALRKGEEITNPSAHGPAKLILCENCFGPQARNATWVSENITDQEA